MQRSNRERANFEDFKVDLAKLLKESAKFDKKRSPFSTSHPQGRDERHCSFIFIDSTSHKGAFLAADGEKQ